MDGLSVEPPVIQVDHGLLSNLLVAELHVNVSHQMIPQVVAHVHFLHLAVLLLHLREDLLKKLIIVLLHLHVADGTGQTISRLSTVLRVPVNVQEGNRLAERRLVV